MGDRIRLVLIMAGALAAGAALAAALHAVIGSEEDSALAVLLDGAGIAVGALALWMAWRQLIPLRSAIEAINVEETRKRRLRSQLAPPRRQCAVLGFDARFTNNDWRSILGTVDASPGRVPVSRRSLSAPKIEPRLSREYNQFYASYSGDEKSKPFEPHVLIVDLMFVPDFVKKGWIQPLSGSLGLKAMLELRHNTHGIEYSDPVRAMLETMCCASGDGVGALPLWINSHGRMIPDPLIFSETRRVAAVSSFSGLLGHEKAEEVFREAGIQSCHLEFEFIAHLAYRGCRLFRPLSGREKAFSWSIADDSDLNRFALAVADLATRLRFSSVTATGFSQLKKGAPQPGCEQELPHDSFGLAHTWDARMLRERQVLWKPVFSSELLWQALPQRNATRATRLTDETAFQPPFARRGDGTSRYMSALGGYGLALSPRAAKDRSSIATLKYLFLANPCMMHPYVEDMLPSDAAEVPDFVARHSRPAWPFWPSIEKELMNTIFGILVLLDRASDCGPKAFHDAAVKAVKGDAARVMLDGFLDSVEAIAAANGWTFQRAAPGPSPR